MTNLKPNIKKQKNSEWNILELLLIFRFIFSNTDKKEIINLHSKLLVTHAISNKFKSLKTKTIIDIEQKILDWKNFNVKNYNDCKNVEEFYFCNFWNNQIKYYKFLDSFDFYLSKNFFYNPLTADLKSSKEGSSRVLQHLSKERDWKLVNAKKQQVMTSKGFLECEVCKFNYKDKYGTRGHNYAEVHHIKPISEYKDDDVTYLKDLAILCSNCHKMIHRKEPWLSIDQLKVMLREEFVA